MILFWLVSSAVAVVTERLIPQSVRAVRVLVIALTVAATAFFDLTRGFSQDTEGVWPHYSRVFLDFGLPFVMAFAAAWAIRARVSPRNEVAAVAEELRRRRTSVAMLGIAAVTFGSVLGGVLVHQATAADVVRVRHAVGVVGQAVGTPDAEGCATSEGTFFFREDGVRGWLPYTLPLGGGSTDCGTFRPGNRVELHLVYPKNGIVVLYSWELIRSAQR